MTLGGIFTPSEFNKALRALDLDIAIFGAGIAGLWTLARLRRAGYRVALFESNAIGGIQSIASQGIIHGGTKYALTGKLTGSAQAIGDMPGIWRAALDGDGDVDLSDTRVLSRQQYLWTSGSLTSSISGFFAGKVMRSRMQALDASDYPAPFDRSEFRGGVYRLDEPVLDVHSLMRALSVQVGSNCAQLRGPVEFERSDGRWRFALNSDRRIEARALVLCAGRGNAQLLQALGRSAPAMQTRPLHMLMLRGELPLLYAHCLGASANPRLTITSYPLADGDVVWYLGGDAAEAGVMRDREAQIEAGRAELGELLPWVDIGACQWATLRIDRAEIATAGGVRPDDAYVGVDDGVITCWPTKLAFAPRVARLVETAARESAVAPSGDDIIGLPRPPLALPPWEEGEIWN